VRGRGADVIPLWEKGAPGSEARKDEPEKFESGHVTNIHNPSLTVYLPAEGKANGAAMVICPGGGHRMLTIESEGTAPAAHLAKLGVTCFVLKYRLAREMKENSPYTVRETAAADGRRAMRLVRSLADKYKIDPKRVGMIGFSAGGEVVALVGYADGTGDPQAADPIDRFSARPDYQILIYPGGTGNPNAIAADAPPTLMIVSMDDVSHVKPVMAMVEMSRATSAPLELHLLSGGGHGWGMGERSKLAAVQHWTRLMDDWLADQGVLRK
jgi:acetyl esterase/lipase